MFRHFSLLLHQKSHPPFFLNILFYDNKKWKWAIDAIVIGLLVWRTEWHASCFSSRSTRVHRIQLNLSFIVEPVARIILFFCFSFFLFEIKETYSPIWLKNPHCNKSSVVRQQQTTASCFIFFSNVSSIVAYTLGDGTSTITRWFITRLINHLIYVLSTFTQHLVDLGRIFRHFISFFLAIEIFRGTCNKGFFFKYIYIYVT